MKFLSKIAFLLTSAFAAAQTPSLQDFGYESIQAIGRPTRGSVPMLVVTVQFSNRPLAMAHGNTYWNNLVFPFGNPNTNRTLNGYYLENSLGAFFFTRAAPIPPLVALNMAETQQVDSARNVYNQPDGTTITHTGYDSDQGRQRLFGYIFAKTSLDWASWDSNGDGQITQGELVILVITNNDPIGGHARDFQIPIPGTGKTLNGSITFASHQASFTTIVHELAHGLGVGPDLYGDGSQNYTLTLMGATIEPSLDNRITYHLDPWYKMRLGWLRPRIFRLDSGGMAKIRCPQSPFPQTEAEGPIILWSPARGKNEYFMVEWRNGNPGVGRGYDAHVEASTFAPAQNQPMRTGDNVVLPEVPGRGLAVWRIRQKEDHSPYLIMPSAGNNGRLWSAHHLSAAVPATWSDGSPVASAFFNRGAFNYGGRVLWDAVTPPVIWEDMTATNVTINPVRIEDDGSSVIVEWLRASEQWVEFGANVASPNGSFERPWVRLNSAVAENPWRGTLKIKASVTSERMEISKPMILTAPLNGPAVIGLQPNP